MKHGSPLPSPDDWLWPDAHHSGTIPMGELPGGLVDEDLKLNFFDNVFICDGSIIQEHSYANTGLTTGALALRVAEPVRTQQSAESKAKERT
jgi:choline dehydrogenase-like flavoprotein